ncbi:MAG TPA: amidohydrolase family protein [Candidatus Limnocylindrales bacterium]
MTSTLYTCGEVRTPSVPIATAMLVRDGKIEWLGDTGRGSDSDGDGDSDLPSADVTVDLGDALVTPAFVDAHVHCTDTGLARLGLDLSGVRSARQLLDAVAEFAGRGDGILLGHGFDESTWGNEQVPPSSAELDRAAGGRGVYLSQASIHSALVSSDLLALAVGEPGYEAAGWVRRDAHHVVREAAFARITTAQRDAAQTEALRVAASLGIAAVHECGGPGTSSEDDFTGLLAKSGKGLPEVYGFWGELLGAAKARELGAVGAGGDLYADGALGSRTAHVRESYLDGDGGCGHGYVTAEQVTEHLLDCHRHGMQGGFHAIGDAAIGTLMNGFKEAARSLGVEAIRAARHRVEHAEIMDKGLIAGFVEFGIFASMQPAFDRLWGGERQMYAQRLGVERSLASNPMGQMHHTGVSLAFGSDSPVTPLDPWGSVRAAMWHFNPAQRMKLPASFAAHTKGGWRSIHRDGEGVLVPGASATFAVWHTPSGRVGSLPSLEPHDELPRCLRTVLRGETIYALE